MSAKKGDSSASTSASGTAPSTPHGTNQRSSSFKRESARSPRLSITGDNGVQSEYGTDDIASAACDFSSVDDSVTDCSTVGTKSRTCSIATTTTGVTVAPHEVVAISTRSAGVRPVGSSQQQRFHSQQISGSKRLSEDDDGGLEPLEVEDGHKDDNDDPPGLFLAKEAYTPRMPWWQLLFFSLPLFAMGCVYGSVACYIVPSMVMLYISVTHSAEVQGMFWIVPSTMCLLFLPVLGALGEAQPRCLCNCRCNCQCKCKRLSRYKFLLIVGTLLIVAALLVLGIGAQNISVVFQSILLCVATLGFCLTFPSWLGISARLVCREQLFVLQIFKDAMLALGFTVGAGVLCIIVSSIRYSYIYYVLVGIILICDGVCLFFPERANRDVCKTKARLRISRVWAAQYALLDGSKMQSRGEMLVLFARFFTSCVWFCLMQNTLFFIKDSFVNPTAFGIELTPFHALGIVLIIYGLIILVAMIICHILIRRAVVTLAFCLYFGGFLMAISLMIPVLFQTSYIATAVAFALYGAGDGFWRYSLEIACKQLLPSNLFPHDRNLGIFWLIPSFSCFIALVPVGAFIDAFVANDKATLGHALIHVFLALMCLIATAIVTFIRRPHPVVASTAAAISASSHHDTSPSPVSSTAEPKKTRSS